MSLLIVNKCLGLLGSIPVQDVQDSEWARVINPLVPTFYSNLLESCVWLFAKEYSTLVQNTLNTNPRYLFSFALPADFVRIDEVYFSGNFKIPKSDYRIQGDNLYCNFETADISYVRSSFDVDKTPESFKLALAYRIIANLAARLLNDSSMVKYYAEMDVQMYGEAVDLNATNEGEFKKITYTRFWI